MVQSEPRIVLGFVTRSRPQHALQCVQSAIDTFGQGTLKIVICVDDDLDTLKALKERKFSNVSLVLIQPRHYYVRGMNTTFLAMRSLCPDMNYFVTASDDLRFKQESWGRNVVDTFERLFPDGNGVLELSTYMGCAHFISSASFFMKRFQGNLFNPAYTQQCCDTELRNILIEEHAYACINQEQQPPLYHAVLEDGLRKEWSYWTAWDRLTFNQRVADGLVPRHDLPDWLAKEDLGVWAGLSKVPVSE
jgi:hypothetical protein